MKKVTMMDVAKLANVSKSTVSQYINSRFDYMGEDTKKRIEQAIQELGYQPNFVARSLKQKKTFTIGVIVANILHSFSTKVIRAIEDICNDSEIHVIVCNADDLPIKEANYINMLLAKQVDGLIIFPTGKNVDIYENMLKNKIPVVFVDRNIEGIPIDSILLDNEKALSSTVAHLSDRGHERIGIITTSLEQKVTPRVERTEGYRKAIQANNLPLDERYIKGLEVNDIPAGLEEMLSLPEPPTAIIAGNDLVLMEILKYTKSKGISIPQKFALVGIDEVPFASFFNPPITTIAQPAYKMGETAAKLLLEKIKGEHREPAKVHRFSPELQIRQTT